MSVAQRVRDRAGHFRWMGLLVVWAVFIAMAAVLLIERAGVQYSAGQHKLGMLAANDAVPASSAMFGQKPTCLVISDTDQAGVEDVKEQFDQILLDMKIAHCDVNIATVARCARYAPDRHHELGERRRFAHARHAAR